MLFFVLTFIVALTTFVAPILLLRFCVQKWHIQPKIFWKAGVAGILVSLLVFGVTINIDGAFPSFNQLPALVQALILGFASGLFIELGKFLVLDRWMSSIRGRETGILFGIGWAGVGIIFTSILLMVGVFGMQSILSTKDFASALPNSDADQIKFLQDSQKQLQDLVNGPLIKAFSPLLENAGTMLLDIAMTLLIILGLNKKQTRYVWIAVGIRTVLATALFFVVQIENFPVEIVLAVWMVIGAILIYYLQKSLKRSAI